MKKHTAILLVTLLALLAPGASAQDRSRRTARSSFDSDEAEVLSSAVQAISRMHMQEFSDSLLWEAAIDGMIEALGDPYASLFTPEEANAWEEETTGTYSGIGLQISLLNEEVTVTAVFRGFPANSMGIEVGDVIIGVNDNDASTWTTEMAADSIRGPEGTEVQVRVRRQGYEQPLSFDITRAQVHVPAVEFGMLDDDIGYVIMDRVARGAASEMSEALDELQDAHGLIIDLRRNPGGFLDESLDLADLFLKRGSVLASTVQRRIGGSVDDPEVQEYDDQYPERVPDLPIVILVDEYTASGAEILTGALQDYDRALVLGHRTFGKGVVQTVMALPHGRRLRFTTGTWLTPLGRSLQRPRDLQMRPLPEDIDALPRVQTAGGRTLVDGGGIFPDLAIEDDTLSLVEQDLVRAASEIQLPLNLRLSEFAFSVANQQGDDGAVPEIGDDALDGFVASLVEEGLPQDLADDAQIRDYLRWSARMWVARRARDVGAEAVVRSERDPVLKEAIQLLSTSTTQADLFDAVDDVASQTVEAAGVQ